MDSMGPDAQQRHAESGDSRPSIFIGGLRIDTLPLPAAVDLLISERRPKSVHLCNAFTVSLASRDPSYRSALNMDELNLVDGMPVVWVARRRGHEHLSDRCSGPDLMERTIEAGISTQVAHFLYGSTPEVLEALVISIGRRWPGARIVGAEAPPFRDLTQEEVEAAVERIKDSGAQIVWVGLGTPKQDFEVHRLSRLVPTTFVAIGAAFDFLAGTKRRAPRWMQRLGLEWTYRLALEPRRLWRRYLIGNARFAMLALRRA